MKHHLLITLFGIGLISITGCYTQIAFQNDDNEDYYEPERPFIIVVPTPQPIIINPIIEDPHPWPQPKPIIRPNPLPDVPEYKYRNPQTDRLSDKKDRDRIRNTGGRNDSGGRGGRR